MRLGRRGRRLLARTRPGPRRSATWFAILSVAGLYVATFSAPLGLLPEISSPWLPTGYAIVQLVRWGYVLTALGVLLPFVLVPALFAPLFAAEKDAGTLEALLLTPVAREVLLRERVRTAWGPLKIYLLGVLPLLCFLPRFKFYYYPGVEVPSLFFISSWGVLYRAAMSSSLSGPPWTEWNALTALAGAVVWVMAVVRVWVMAWLCTMISVRARTKLRALLWSSLIVMGVFGLEVGASFFLTERGARVDPLKFLKWSIAADVGVLVSVVLLVLWLRRLAARHFEAWALGKQA